MKNVALNRINALMKDFLMTSDLVLKSANPLFLMLQLNGVLRAFLYIITCIYQETLEILNKISGT